jgi:hypothetical protein
MKIDCVHGYFIFEETSAGQFSSFMSRFDQVIERSKDHFTFEFLVNAPDYAIKGSTYLGAPVKETFEGRPWEIMRVNDLVYDFTKGLVVPIATITQAVEIKASGSFYLANGMILPGSLTDEGLRVTDYSAFYIWERLGFKYSEIDYE